METVDVTNKLIELRADNEQLKKDKSTLIEMYREAKVKEKLERLQKLEKVEDAIREYNLALTNRKHGGVAQNKAFDEICTILDMHWSFTRVR